MMGPEIGMPFALAALNHFHTTSLMLKNLHVVCESLFVWVCIQLELL